MIPSRKYVKCLHITYQHIRLSIVNTLPVSSLRFLCTIPNGIFLDGHLLGYDEVCIGFTTFYLHVKLLIFKEALLVYSLRKCTEIICVTYVVDCFIYLTIEFSIIGILDSSTKFM